MTFVPIGPILDLPSLEVDDRLRAVLQAAMAAAGEAPVQTPGDRAFWGPEFFGLDRVSAFVAATADQQQQILVHASQALLEEAWYIERCGLTFTAKMCLLAETTEERMLYSLFAADEARHYHQVSAWLAGTESPGPSAFHELLAEVIRDGDRDSLVVVIQVLLEGWGLRHYRDMAAACRDERLGATLHGIVQDETRHHGSGVMMFTARGLPGNSLAVATEVLSRFLSMVRTGPQGVLSAVDGVVGPLDRDARVTILTELDCVAHATERLEFLRSLLKTRAAAPLREALEARDLFTALSAEAAA